MSSQTDQAQDTMLEQGEFCSQCGNKMPCKIHSTHEQELTVETVAHLQNLEITVEANFGPVLQELRTRTGADLQAREESFHVTVIGPTEASVLKQLDKGVLAELHAISERIRQGKDITVTGIGYIDGSTREDLRDVDKIKKVAFLALTSEKLNQFRASLGLPPRYLHVTIGFEGGDIHNHIDGVDAKGKPQMALIPKEADPRFADIAVPKLSFSGLSGKMKEEKKLEPPKPEQKKQPVLVYDLARLIPFLIQKGVAVSTIQSLNEKVQSGDTTIDAKVLGGLLRADMAKVKKELDQYLSK